MRTLVTLFFALTSVACQPTEAPATPEPAAKPAKETPPVEAAAKKPEPPPKAKKVAPPVDPMAKWKREPVKKVPAPPDVRKARKKGTKLTMAGVRYRVMQPGTGKDNPTIKSTVTLHYTGWTTNGRMFDSSLKTGEPATFGLSGLIDGWKDVIQYMVVGDVFRVWIPEKLAYKGKAGRPAGTLVFDIELLDFK